jgi:3D (Asp-Asp-Asp) domain-containing protein
MKYRLSDNLISAVLGVLIAIPICIVAHKEEIIANEVVPNEIVTIEYSTEADPIVEVETVTEIETTTEETTTEEETTYRENLGSFIITAYCPCSKCCGEWADGITSTGTVATEGRTIAVDPSVIPYGSVVEINGISYIAEDCGDAIK